jgi:uncharacterized protein (TIGR00290 family)
MSDHPAPIPILVAWSGGKDSAWTLHRLQLDPKWQVCALLTQVEERSGRVSIHGLSREFLQAQATAANLPFIEVPLPLGPDNACYEKAFATGLQAARSRWPALRHIAFGDLFLGDIRAWREALCQRLGWDAVFPLFGCNTRQLADEMVAAGVRATLCCVDRQQLDPGFAGREFDHRLLRDLPDGVDACGENGEFHTGVTAGPMLQDRLTVQPITVPVSADDRFAYCELRLRGSS